MKTEDYPTSTIIDFVFQTNLSVEERFKIEYKLITEENFFDLVSKVFRLKREHITREAVEAALNVSTNDQE